MRKLLHFLLAMFGVIPWTIGYFGFVLAIVVAKMCDRLIPGADTGNCWTFTLPLWSRQGGYLIIRPASDVKLLGFLIVPHAIWARSLEPIDLQQTIPIKRAHAKWIPWQTLYFRFRISRQERDHPAKEIKR